MGRRRYLGGCPGLRALWRRPSGVRIPPPALEFALPMRAALFVWRILGAFAWHCADPQGALSSAWEWLSQATSSPRKRVRETGDWSYVGWLSWCPSWRHIHARARGDGLWSLRGSRMQQLDRLRLSSPPSNPYQ